MTEKDDLKIAAHNVEEGISRLLSAPRALEHERFLAALEDAERTGNDTKFRRYCSEHHKSHMARFEERMDALPSLVKSEMNALLTLVRRDATRRDED